MFLAAIASFYIDWNCQPTEKINIEFARLEQQAIENNQTFHVVSIVPVSNAYTSSILVTYELKDVDNVNK